MASIDSPAGWDQGDSAIEGQGARDRRGPVTAVSGPGVTSTVRRSLVFLLLALFALQVGLTWLQLSPASDEVSILPAGYIFLKTGHWFIPEHPPLGFVLSALPLLLLNPRFDANDPQFARERPNPWDVGLNFLGLNN